MKKKYNSPKIEIIDVKSEIDIAGMADKTNDYGDPGNSGMTESQSNPVSAGLQNPFANSSSPIYGDQD